jgi:spermidine synthase
VKPWEIVERALAPDGAEIVLARRDGEWVVRAAGRVLMSSRQHGSEDGLAALALKRAARRRTVLIGGLGLGFTVRAALDRVPTGARVVVAELSTPLVAWNRTHLAALAGRPLDDPRVRVQAGDVLDRLREAPATYDAILLDVDNGPSAVAHAANGRLYDEEGIGACRTALREGGVLAVWSAGADARFLARLGRAGLDAEAVIVPGRGAAGGVRHVVFLARRQSEPAQRRRP